MITTEANTLRIEVPDWGEPFLKPARYKGLYGGRGSRKSWFTSECFISKHIKNPDEKSLCVREFQSSLDKSVKPLLESQIERYNLWSYFESQQNCIKSRHGNGRFDFVGMSTQTQDSIKSFEGYHNAWVEEAQTMSYASLELLRPTIRVDPTDDHEGSELWFTWNPKHANDPVDKLFRGEYPPPEAVSAFINYWNNEHFPEVLRKEMEYDKARDYSKYLHIWEGEYEQNSEARVFKHWCVRDFETPEDAFFRFGADWGFSIDPTVLVRCFIVGRNLYVDYEAHQVGCDIVDTPTLFASVPESDRYPIVADRNSPAIISHMRKNGYPKIIEASQGRKSVEEGVGFLQSYDIIVHPRCVNVIDELKEYSYKIDPHTKEVTSILSERKNHTIDALRYALESVRRLEQNKQEEIHNFELEPMVSYW